MNKRLLILACSQKKRSDPGLMIALDRYDGPAFKVLRKFLREYPEKSDFLDIYILSAEFGLICADTEIPNYDRKLQPERAQELQAQVAASLAAIFNSTSYRNIFVGASQSYLTAVISLKSLLPPNCNLQISQGGLGRRLTELLSWLHQGETPKSLFSSRCRSDFPRIKGVDITLTREQVFAKVQSAIEGDKKLAHRCQSWFIEIGSYQVSPKWLVSQITNLPVRRFGTHDACRVLNQLGIEVKRR